MGFHNSGLQVAEYEYDFSVDGGAVSTIALSAKANKKPLPAGAIVTGAVTQVEVAGTSGGSATVQIGNQAAATAYMANTAVAALTLNAVAKPAVTSFAVVAGTNDLVNLAIAAAALTAGKIKLWISYHY